MLTMIKIALFVYTDRGNFLDHSSIYNVLDLREECIFFSKSKNKKYPHKPKNAKNAIHCTQLSTWKAADNFYRSPGREKYHRQRTVLFQMWSLKYITRVVHLVQSQVTTQRFSVNGV